MVSIVPCRCRPSHPAAPGTCDDVSVGYWLTKYTLGLTLKILFRPRAWGVKYVPRRGPVILAAGVLKVPALLGPAGAHIHGQVVVGVIVCGIAAYLSVRFLVRWFQTRTLTPFAIYCLAFGALSIFRFL